MNLTNLSSKHDRCYAPSAPEISKMTIRFWEPSFGKGVYTSSRQRRILMTKPQINVTPLIDDLLVLLIIFMVVTPMKPSAFDAKIPAEPNDDSSVKVHPDTLIVTIGNDS